MHVLHYIHVITGKSMIIREIANLVRVSYESHTSHKANNHVNRPYRVKQKSQNNHSITKSKPVRQLPIVTVTAFQKRGSTTAHLSCSAHF